MGKIGESRSALGKVLLLGVASAVGACYGLDKWSSTWKERSIENIDDRLQKSMDTLGVEEYRAKIEGIPRPIRESLMLLRFFNRFNNSEGYGTGTLLNYIVGKDGGIYTATLTARHVGEMINSFECAEAGDMNGNVDQKPIVAEKSYFYPYNDESNPLSPKYTDVAIVVSKIAILNDDDLRRIHKSRQYLINRSRKVKNLTVEEWRDNNWQVAGFVSAKVGSYDRQVVPYVDDVPYIENSFFGSMAKVSEDTIAAPRMSGAPVYDLVGNIGGVASRIDVDVADFLSLDPKPDGIVIAQIPPDFEQWYAGILSCYA